jgi:hypothetical protein
MTTDWSQIWTFRKDWDIPPILLTPTNSFAWVRFPFFSWTPVPGASHYRLELDDAPDFTGANYTWRDTANTYASAPREYGSVDPITGGHPWT